MVRAKMFVESVTQPEALCDIVMVKLRAVYTDSEENKSFSKWTPYAEMTMSITNPDAYPYFEQGKEYYLDFKKAE